MKGTDVSSGEMTDKNNSNNSPDKKTVAATAAEAKQKQPAFFEVVNMSNGAGDNKNRRSSSSPSKKKNSSKKSIGVDLEKMTALPSTQSLSSPPPSSSSPSKSTCSKATKCFLILSMGLIIILAAIILAILKFNLLDNEDQCLIANQPFHDNQFKLFTTKTTYKSAFDYLASSLKSSKQAPSVFVKDATLQSINDDLTSPANNCKVRQLHYYGRHAARFPDADDIKKYNEAISNIQARIDLSKFLAPTITGVPSSELPPSSDSVTIVSNNDIDNNSTNQKEKVCSNPMTQYKQWRTSMHPDQDNLVTDSGFQETEEIATRLKEVFPQMFDASYSDISIRTTGAIRTAQTAVPFLKHLFNYTFNECSAADFPPNNSSSEAVRSNKCLNDLNKATYSKVLEFHKECEKLVKQKHDIGPGVSFGFFGTIARSVSERLKLLPTAQLTTGDVKIIYNVCKYETALSGSSIWCNLFTENELKFYEYFDDLEDFYTDAYGSTEQARSACPVASDIATSFEDYAKYVKPQTYFHFTHSQVIRKMVAASFELSSDEAYKDDSAVESHLKAGSVPEHREWRTSLFTPFSANLIFTLYECNPNSSNPNGYRDVTVNDQAYKVVVSLNERPVQMKGCSGVVCGMREFINRSKFGRIGFQPECNFKVFCEKKYNLKIVP